MKELHQIIRPFRCFIHFLQTQPRHVTTLWNLKQKGQSLLLIPFQSQGVNDEKSADNDSSSEEDDDMMDGVRSLGHSIPLYCVMSTKG